MRAGWVVSAIGHIGFVMMTLLAWESRSALPQQSGAVVPVEIVDVAPESNVRALAMDVPDEEVSPQTNPEEPESEPAATPETRPPRPRPRWDPSSVAGLFNQENDPGPEPNEGDPSDRNQDSAGPGTAETVALRDRVRAVGRAHLRRCWRMPVDLPNPDRLIVVVEFNLNRNGTLNGQPRVVTPRNYTFDPYMRAAAESALRAVRQCDPFPFADDPVLSEHYELWREPEVEFNPSAF